MHRFQDANKAALSWATLPDEADEAAASVDAPELPLLGPLLGPLVLALLVTELDALTIKSSCACVRADALCSACSSKRTCWS